MSWENSTRRSRLPADWPRRRARILRRDRRRCRWPLTYGGECGAEANEVDHRNGGDDHSEANLWTLCRWHHNAKTQAEALAAQPQQQTKRRGADRHPGAL